MELTYGFLFLFKTIDKGITCVYPIFCKNIYNYSKKVHLRRAMKPLRSSVEQAKSTSTKSTLQ